MKRVIAIAVVLAMCMLPAAALLQDDSMAATENVTVRPHISDYVVWVTTDKVTYPFDDYVYVNNPLFFSDNPYDDVVRYVNGEISFATLKTLDGYTTDGWTGTHYVVCLEGYVTDNVDKRIVPVETAPLMFLDTGDYTYDIVDTNLSYVSVGDGGRNYESATIKEGKGTIEIELSKPAALQFSGNLSYSGDWIPWTEAYITYNLDPVPTVRPDQSEFTDKATIQSNWGAWYKYTTETTFNGEVQRSSSWGKSNMYMFEEGSAEEADFVSNVIDKNLTGETVVPKNTITVENKRLVFYTCTDDDRSSIYLGVRPAGSHDSYEYSSYNVSEEKVSKFDDTPYRFYSVSDYKIGVKYDTDNIKYVALRYPDPYDSRAFIPLESGKLYDLEWNTAGEYELVAVMWDDTETMGPVEIDIYTENVAQADDYGMVFAAVAITLCVIAFGILFISGRRPKWKDNSGLTETEED